MNAIRTWENAVVFGQFEHLLGIHRKPKRNLPVDDVAVLMLNAGMLQSSGPFRLHVDLARALGNSGMHSLRFDLSGIGESLAIGAEGCSLERAAAEVSAAIDFLTAEYGIRRFALFGLCSGADDAIFAATKDERIGSIFALDGLGYRTIKFHWHRLTSHYMPKLCSVKKWLQACRSAIGIREATPDSLQLGEDIREFPNRDVAAEQLQELLAREVRLHFHYTGGVGQYYNYAEQFRDMFPELRPSMQGDSPLLSSTFNPLSDHVGFLNEHRADIVRRACRSFVAFANATPAQLASQLAGPCMARG